MAAIADVHAGGPNMAVEHISRVVDQTNALRPDLVVLLGDYIATHRFVTEHVPPEVWAAQFARLSARSGCGRFSATTTGGLMSMRCAARLNGWAFPASRTGRFCSAKARLASGSRALATSWHIVLGRGTFRGEDDLPGTLRQVTTDHPVILLAHEPDIFVQVPERVCLTLAGHTHGGQIRIPLIWTSFVPSRYGARFAYGHIVEGGRHMIVSGGLGTSFAPVRLGIPPEIVHIEIGA